MINNIKTFLLIVLCVGTLKLHAQTPTLNKESLLELGKASRKISNALFLISNMYVDTVNIGKITESAVIGALKDLDPHSTYISKEEFNSMNEPLQGNFEGIGIEFNILNDTLMVVNTVSGGPSEKVGLLSSDRIIAVDGKNIAGVGLTNSNVFKLLRGVKGSIIKVTVSRKDTNEPLEFTIVRDKIPLYSLDACYEVKPGIMYLKLGRFAVNSMNEIFEAHAKYMETNQEPKSLILDLRGNGGGILGTASDLADQFFGEGKLIVYTEGIKAPRQNALSTNDGIFKGQNLVVLVDEGSASASEIVSGAIQDWDRGVIIGRRTFGKGLVQQQFPLEDGSFIRLTVSRYHTPTGRVIQRPYDNGKSEKYYEDLYKRFSDGEVYHKDSIKFPDSLKYKTLKYGRTVYGGGGIMPDIFIPLDTLTQSKYSGQLYRRGIINQFVIAKLDSEKEQLKSKFKTFSDFNKNYSVDDAMFEDLVKFAEKEKIERDPKGIETSGNELRLVVKALIARGLFGNSEYFQVINSRGDSAYNKAIEVLENWKKYEQSILFSK